MKPILFNAEMVKAILDGRKTQTRRVIKLKHGEFINDAGLIITNKFPYFKDCSYKVGDIFYVRETFSEWLTYEDRSLQRVTYKASDEDCNGKWKPSIHMPKEYARIFLKVTNIRIERLKNTTWQDIIKEGLSEYKDYNEWGNYHRENWEFSQGINKLKNDWIKLWNSTAPKGYKWEDNPYVFVYEFERITQE